jgi:hypothetical protein
MSDLSRRAAIAGIDGRRRAVRRASRRWPDKTIAMIVPYPAGGGSDTFARPVAAAMADRLKQSIVIDNKSGAGGTVGTAVAARAPADGYTLLLGDTGLTYAPDIYPRTDFDFDRDFAPISAGRARALRAGGQSRQAQRGDARGLHRGGEESARRIDVGSAGLGNRHASRHRPARGEDGHEAEPRALSRRARRCCRTFWPARSPPPSSCRAPSPRM